MAATIFSDVLRPTSPKNKGYGGIEVRDWYRDQALQVTKQDVSSRKAFIYDKDSKHVKDPVVGKMLFYNYDPKHKKTLPYYDTFPMVFPIEIYPDGFLGINLHYLPPVYRARLMDALYDTLNNQRYDTRSKLQINYKILKAAAKMKYFKPCIKRYLTSHIRTPLMEVDIKEWDWALFLPVANFKKASERKVWDDSIRAIMG